MTIPDPFCMPLIDDILDNVGDCPYLSKLNLANQMTMIKPHFVHHSDNTGSFECLSD